MKLSDMRPDNIVLEINGTEYPLSYTFRSLRELETLYGSEEKYQEAVRRIMLDLGKAKRQDFVNFLHAGLIGSDFYPVHLVDKRPPVWRVNREGCIEYLEPLLVPRNLPEYATVILASWAAANITEEMLEILEIMSAGREKKTEADAPSGPASMPSPQ